MLRAIFICRYMLAVRVVVPAADCVSLSGVDLKRQTVVRSALHLCLDHGAIFPSSPRRRPAGPLRQTPDIDQASISLMEGNQGGRGRRRREESSAHHHHDPKTQDNVSSGSIFESNVEFGRRGSGWWTVGEEWVRVQGSGRLEPLYEREMMDRHIANDAKIGGKLKQSAS